MRISMPSKYMIMSNIVAAVCLICITVKFSTAHFTYALIPWLLFMGVILCHQGVIASWRKLRWGSISIFWIGFLSLYGSLFVSSFIMRDWESISASGNLVWMSFSFFLFYTLGRFYDTSEGIQLGVLGGSMILAMAGLYQWYYHPDVRLSIFSLHPNGFGTLIIILCPVLLYYVWKSIKIWKKFLFLFIILILLFDLYHTESRGAMMALSSGVAATIIIVIMVRNDGNFFYRKSIGLILSAVMLIVGIYLVYNVSSERHGLGKSGGERVMMLESSYKMWKDHKLAGVGVARWAENYYSDEYHPQEGKEKNLDMPHNMPAYFLSTAGTIGGLGYLVFLLTSFCILYKKIRKTKEIWFDATMMTVFGVFTIHGLVDTTIINKDAARLYFALWGYYLARTATSSLRSGQGHSLSS